VTRSDAEARQRVRQLRRQLLETFIGELLVLENEGDSVAESSGAVRHDLAKVFVHEIPL